MQDNRFVLVIVGILGLVGAILIGTWLPDANPRSLLYVATIVLTLIYSLALSNCAVYFALLAIAFDIQLRPFGFDMPLHIIVGALLGPVFLLSIWRKDLQPPKIVHANSRGFHFMAAVALSYIAIHFWYTWKSPLLVFAFANVGKYYYTLVFSFFLILWFTLKPPSLYLPKATLTALGRICLAGLLFNIVARIYGTYVLGLGTSEFEGATEFSKTAIYVPFINLTENIYGLRILSPFVGLTAATILTSGNSELKSRSVRTLFMMLIVLSIFGALISMGRATVLFTFAMIAFIFVWRRRAAPLIVFGLLGILTIGFIRIGYEASPTSIPESVQRAVAIIPGLGMENAADKIKSSSDWRYQMFQRALEEWQSNQRIFWFGRSTAGISNSDMAQYAMSQFKDSVVVDISLKRGATHNLLTDYLVVTGLIGTIIFFFLWFAAINLMFRFARASTPHSPERQVFIIAGIFSVFQLVYGVIGGASFPIQSAVLVCLGILVLRRTEDNTSCYGNSQVSATRKSLRPGPQSNLQII